MKMCAEESIYRKHQLDHLVVKSSSGLEASIGIFQDFSGTTTTTYK